MLAEVLEYLNNWFVQEIYTDTFEITEDGDIDLPFLQSGQYFRVCGSIFNDGVYKYGDKLEPETFDGEILALAIPKTLTDIVTEIETWQKKYGDSVSGPYASENFAGQYSYTKASGADGAVTSWKTAFKDRLAPYMKLKGCDYAQPAYQGRPYYAPFNPDHPYGV